MKLNYVEKDFRDPNAKIWTTVNSTTNIVIREDGNLDAMIIHAWIQWVAWGIFGFVQLLSARFMKNLPFAMWIHTLSGIFVCVVSFVLSLLAI